MNTDDLLTPSIGRPDAAATSIYSARTGYVSSFFGGPLAGATIALANSYRLRRLGKDWPLGLLAIAANFGAVWGWYRGGEQWFEAHLGQDAQQLALRVLGLGFFALAYGWHRQYYRNMAMFGLTPPSGWVIGLIAVAGNIAVNVALAVVLS